MTSPDTESIYRLEEIFLTDGRSLLYASESEEVRPILSEMNSRGISQTQGRENVRVTRIAYYSEIEKERTELTPRQFVNRKRPYKLEIIPLGSINS